MLIYTLLGLSTIAAGLLAGRAVWSLRRFKYRPVEYVSESLPTISVCIAARNETHALAQCLERVLKSDYPKLEILVLDDSSNDDTSLIIKSFAQAGVRFIAGSELPQGWLGKNHAYQTLIAEASGKYVLFLGVDTTIRVTTISQLVSQMLGNNKSMLSVLPRREDTYRTSAILGTMRYYWELLLGTRENPPASSAIWMVDKQKLSESGVGLPNYGLSVRPERHLARQLQHDNLYKYIIGTNQLGVGYEKRLHSQYETALRLYYPASGRTLWLWLVASIYLALLIVPLFIFYFSATDILAILWAASLIVLTAVSFGLFVFRTYGRTPGLLLRVGLGPVLVIQEFILLTTSYVMYRTGKITWKGRAVAAQPNKHDALKLDE